VLAAGRARRYGGCKPLAPVGPAGEPVIDLLVGDAIAAGFGRVVLVVSPSNGPAIRYRVERCWPEDVEVRFAVQPEPRGTVDAVLAAAQHLPVGSAFAVANADDIYGQSALVMLQGYLAENRPEHAMVAFHLANSVVSDAPVTRGLCTVSADGWLESIDERRQVRPVPGGGFAANDGLQPAELSGRSPVSVNLWGFAPSILETARTTMHLHESAGGREDGSAEILLPDMVAGMLHQRSRDNDGHPHLVRVLVTEERCIGVTHPGDLELVQADLARQVANGQRASSVWGALRPGREVTGR
jgi:hypothetical protein